MSKFKIVKRLFIVIIKIIVYTIFEFLFKYEDFESSIFIIFIIIDFVYKLVFFNNIINYNNIQKKAFQIVIIIIKNLKFELIKIL